jgi:hypothetical protein
MLHRLERFFCVFSEYPGTPPCNFIDHQCRVVSQDKIRPKHSVVTPFCHPVVIGVILEKAWGLLFTSLGDQIKDMGDHLLGFGYIVVGRLG